MESDKLNINSNKQNFLSLDYDKTTLAANSIHSFTSTFTNASNDKHLPWYAYEIQRFEREKKLQLEEEHELYEKIKDYLMRSDAYIPNSIIMQKLNDFKFTKQ